MIYVGMNNSERLSLFLCTQPSEATHAAPGRKRSFPQVTGRFLPVHGSMMPLLPWGCGASVGASIEFGRK